MLGWFIRAGQGDKTDRSLTIPISFNSIYAIVATLINPNANSGDNNCTYKSTVYFASVISSYNSSTITLRRDGGNDGSNCFVIIGS